MFPNWIDFFSQITFSLSSPWLLKCRTLPKLLFFWLLWWLFWFFSGFLDLLFSICCIIFTSLLHTVGSLQGLVLDVVHSPYISLFSRLSYSWFYYQLQVNHSQIWVFSIDPSSENIMLISKYFVDNFSKFQTF